VLQRGITTAETAGAAGSRRRPARARPARTPAPDVAPAAIPAAAGAASGAASVAATARRRGPLSPAALAIAAKDARYLWRDPQLKASLLSSLFLLILVLLPNGAGGHRPGDLGGATGSFLDPIRVLFVPIPAMVVAFNLSLNALGLERSGLQMLFLFPVRPLDVLWGKNLTVGAISFAAQVVLTVAVAALTGGWFYLPLALVAGLAAVLVLMGCGNVTSVLLPFPVRDMRMGRARLSSENGCLRSVLAMGALFVSALLLTPVAAAIAVPLILDERGWLVGTMPAALLYAVALHQIASRIIAPRLLARAPEILAATIRE
jgi:hypothetical protein